MPEGIRHDCVTHHRLGLGGTFGGSASGSTGNTSIVTTLNVSGGNGIVGGAGSVSIGELGAGASVAGGLGFGAGASLTEDFDVGGLLDTAGDLASALAEAVAREQALRWRKGHHDSQEPCP